MRSIQVIRNFIKTRGSVRWGIALSILLSVILMPSCASASPSPQVNESIKLSESSQSGENTQPGGDHGLYENPQTSSNPQTSELPLPDLQEQLAAFPEDYSSEQALKDGFLVFNNSPDPDVAIGEKFIKDVLAGNPASLRIYQSTTEGDPILSLVVYDGHLYQYCVDNSRDKFAGQSADKYRESSYAYLIVYEQEEGRYVFLMQDNSLTYEDLLKSMTSSSSAVRIDCQLLFIIPA